MMVYVFALSRWYGSPVVQDNDRTKCVRTDKVTTVFTCVSTVTWTLFEIETRLESFRTRNAEAFRNKQTIYGSPDIGGFSTGWKMLESYEGIVVLLVSSFSTRRDLRALSFM